MSWSFKESVKKFVLRSREEKERIFKVSNFGLPIVTEILISSFCGGAVRFQLTTVQRKRGKIDRAEKFRSEIFEE